MPRGRKKQEKYTLKEQMDNLEKQIAEAELNLKDLKEKRKRLNEKVKEEEKEKLYKAVIQSGKSVEEIIAGISGKEEME